MSPFDLPWDATDLSSLLVAGLALGNIWWRGPDTPLDASGGAPAVEAVDHALRASEERWRSVFENSGIGISLAGPQGRFIAANRAFEQMLGYPEPELRELTFADITHPDDCAVNVALVRQLWDGVIPRFLLEKRYRHKDGRIIWVRNTVTLVPGAKHTERFSMAMHEDISDRKRAAEDVEHMLGRLRALAAGIETAREEERTRVSREIHDELGQSLTAIKLDLDSLVRQLPAGQDVLAAKGRAILVLADEAIRTVRRIATALRPGLLDDLGLVAAVEWAAEQFQTRTGVKVSLATPEDLELDAERATAVFRIFQETLTNVARHAHATRLDVTLRREGRDILLDVRDNGQGFAGADIRASRSLGLLGMGERAELLGGRLTFEARPGDGTRVTLRIPASADRAREQA